MSTDEYMPSPREWVREQVEAYEASGGAEANTLRDTGLPIVVFTMIGHKSGKVRKVPLMRVEHHGQYALVGTQGGAPVDPHWVANLDADPSVTIQDGTEMTEAKVRRVEGEDRRVWWERAVAVFPTYDDYAARTDRQVPVFVATPR